MVSLTVLQIYHLVTIFRLRTSFVIFKHGDLLSNTEQQWETMLSFIPHHRGTISKLYDVILCFGNHSNVKFKHAWEGELGIQIHDESWELAIGRIRSTTSCAHLGLIQFKVVYRAHFSKSRLSELYSEVDDKCDKCHCSPCHLSHVFFLCTNLEGFWVGYFTIMSTVTMSQKDIIAFTSLLARHLLLMHWKMSFHFPLA